MWWKFYNFLALREVEGNVKENSCGQVVWLIDYWNFDEITLIIDQLQIG